MRRLAFALVLTAGLIGIGAPAAEAKTPDEVVITGPGVDRPLTIRQAAGQEVWNDTDPVRRLCLATGLCGASGLSPDGIITDPVSGPPPGELGAEYAVDFGGFGIAYVHPYAADGPWTRIFRPGRIGEGDGWVRAGNDVASLLCELGVPLDTPTSPVRSTIDAGLVTGGIVAIILVPLGLLLVRQRRLG